MESRLGGSYLTDMHQLRDQHKNLKDIVEFFLAKASSLNFTDSSVVNDDWLVIKYFQVFLIISLCVEDCYCFVVFVDNREIWWLDVWLLDFGSVYGRSWTWYSFTVLDHQKMSLWSYLDR